MKKHILAISIGAALWVLPGIFSPGAAQPGRDYLSSSLNILTSHTLEAYNLGDYLEFYRYFSEKMDQVTSARHFDNQFRHIYRNDLGRVLEYRLLQEKSRIDHHYPIMVYEGMFEKFSPVLITVNFANQHGNYRITSIRFDKVHPEFKNLP